MDDSSGERWPSGLSSRIGAAIRSAREAENVSAVKLAKRTSELGYPIHRTAIANIEAGERAITVQELVILAAALNTSPLALLLDTADETIQILPGSDMNVADVIGWFTGTTGATPPGVTSKRPQRIELMMRLNEVDEQVARQQENLLQARAAAFTAPDALQEHQDGIVRHTQGLLDSLEGKRDSILRMLNDPLLHMLDPAFQKLGREGRDDG